jgi:hypothetical protein
MSKITSITMAVAMIAALGGPARAQTNALQSYEAFLAQHPTFARVALVQSQSLAAPASWGSTPKYGTT